MPSQYQVDCHHSDYPTVTLQPNESDIHKDDLKTMHNIAAVRFNLMYSRTTFEMMIYSVEYRFLELKMLMFQWRCKALVLSFLSEEQRSALHLSQRVMSQFKDYLFALTGYTPPTIPTASVKQKSGSKGRSKGKGKPQTTEQQLDAEWAKTRPLQEEMTQIAVSLVSDCLLVIDCYEKYIENDDTKDDIQSQDIKSFGLTDIMRWYEKLTFFMSTVIKAMQFRQRTKIVIYKREDPGRNTGYFDNVYILHSIDFEEIESPIQIIERIVRETKFPPIPKEFDYEAIKDYFRKSWARFQQDSDDEVSNVDQTNTKERRKKRKQRKHKQKHKRQ